MVPSRVLVLLLAVVAAGAAVEWRPVSATWPDGQVFVAGEQTRINLGGLSGTDVVWRVVDPERRELAHGRAVIAPDGGFISLALPAGYYTFETEVWANVELTHRDPDHKYPTDRPLWRGRASLAALPPLSLDELRGSPFGVCTHFAQGWDTDVMPLMARAGIVTFRDEQYWDEVERQPGRFEFAGKYQGYLAKARKLGLEPLTILSFANPHYDGGDTPHTPEGYAAYARYAEAVAKQGGDQLTAFEVWNEYNGSFCKGPATKQRHQAYTDLLKAAYAKLKAARPVATVVGGAAVLLPKPWFQGLLERGALDALDVVAIHPYRDRPEGVEEEIAALRALIRQYNHGREKPIWATETGLQDRSEGPEEQGQGTCELGRLHVAKYLARQMTLLRAAGVERCYWYLLRDYEDFVTMGLLRGPDDPMGGYAVTPAYVAYATLIRQLHDAQPGARVASPRPVRIYPFRRPRGPVHVAWATEPQTVEVAATGPVTICDLFGRETTLTPVDGRAPLPLTDSAVYLTGPITGFVWPETAETLLADSALDYREQQGQGGWSYGYFVGGAFRPMHTATNEWGTEWRGEAPYQGQGADSLHPGIVAGKPSPTVRRWTSPVAGRLRLKGLFRHDAQGDGVGGRVLVDGQVVFDQLLGGPNRPGEASFDQVVEVKAGSVVDFVVTPGPGTNLDYDATTMVVTIARVAQ